MRSTHSMPFGAEFVDGGVRFRLWAPTAEEVRLVLDGAELAMPTVEGGWRELVVPECRAGQLYSYRVDRSLIVPDPASRFQPQDVHGPSCVIDPGTFLWSDEGWMGRPWADAVIYEVHVGTATPEGTYQGLIDRLEYLRDLGVTALELMPLADFPGRRNWGYDGVLLYAPDSAYGQPEDLKRLVDRAHALDLMVLLDVVYNHFGPSGNYLHAYAKSFFTDRHQTPWGAGLNFDGRSGPVVRNFFVHNALFWLEEYHMDGLRLDAVHAILDDSDPHILEELSTRVRARIGDRHVHLVLENDDNEARYLERDPDGRPQHYTAQWNDDVHHCWHVLLTGETEGYYEDYADDPVGRLGRCLAEGFAYQGEPSTHRGGAPRGEASDHLPPIAFVAFLQNHDQIGNRAMGERISQLCESAHLALARAVLLLAPQTPLIFMGEEWAASTPFLFFVDFSGEPSLQEAVREGRRREFQRFSAFVSSEASDLIPDPTAEKTFVRSRLDWSEPMLAPHSTVLGETRRLLGLRRQFIAPVLRTPFLGTVHERSGPDALRVSWRYEAGTIHVLANFGPGPVRLTAPERPKVLWASSGAQHSAGMAELPSWAGLVLTDEPA